MFVPAGQYADHVIGLVALDADGTVVEVGLRLLVALPDGADLQLADGLLRRVTKTTLWERGQWWQMFCEIQTTERCLQLHTNSFTSL